MIALIGWALIHALWQGAVIAVALACLLAAMRRATPRLRYALALGALALIIIAPVVTALRGRARDDLGATSAPRSEIVGRASSPAAAPLALAPSRASGQEPAASNATANRDAASAQVVVPTGVAHAARVSWRSAEQWLDASAPWLVRGWLAGLLVLSLRLFGGIARTRQLVRDGTHAADAQLQALAVRLAHNLGVRVAVRLLITTRAQVPLVIGWLRPVVLVPASLATGFTPQQIEMLLAHELAHIRRHDFLLNVLQTVVETLLFFHPAVWWISERIRDEREQCCDDIAVRLCRADRTAYAATLLALEEWCGEPLGLAAAATGGSLIHRVRRLLGNEPAHVDLGPRWFAGVITVVTVLLAVGRSAGIAAAPPATNLHVSGPAETLGDTARARPARVLRTNAAGTLDARWQWAEQASTELGFRSYWIGYSIAGDSSGRVRYRFDRHTPIRIGGDVTLSGMTIFGPDDNESYVLSGVPLEPLIGPHRPTDVVVLLGYEAPRLGARRLSRIYVGTSRFPVHFGGWPLLWLDAAPDAESAARIRVELATTRSEEVRRDLVATLGVHRETGVAVPALIGVLNDAGEVSGVRQEAAEWLGRHPERAALTALAVASRRDRDRGVRREAIESFAHMEIDAVSDTLMAFVRTIDDTDLQKEAVEALGHRPDERVITFLLALTDGDQNPDLSVAAVEALGNLPDNKGMTHVTALARTHQQTRIRRAAVEELGHLEPTGRALDALLEIARGDADASVRSEAAETIADVHDERAVSMLRRLIDEGNDTKVQAKAVEALASTVAPEDALRVLGEIVRGHGEPEVVQQAVEALGDFDDARAVALLLQIAETNGEPSVQRRAAESLGDVHPHDAALAALHRLAWKHPRAEVRRQAVEGFSNFDKDATALASLREIATTHPDLALRKLADELLHPE